MAINLIASDAETKKFKTGTFLKLSDCPTDFQAHFKSARQVDAVAHYHHVLYTLHSTLIGNREWRPEWAEESCG